MQTRWHGHMTFEITIEEVTSPRSFVLNLCDGRWELSDQTLGYVPVWHGKGNLSNVQAITQAIAWIEENY